MLEIENIIEFGVGGAGAYYLVTAVPKGVEKFLKWVWKKFKKWWRLSKRRLKKRVKERKARREPIGLRPDSIMFDANEEDK